VTKIQVVALYGNLNAVGSPRDRTVAVAIPGPPGVDGVDGVDGDGGSGGSLTIREVDGTPTGTATTLEFPNGSVSFPAAGVARIAISKVVDADRAGLLYDYANDTIALELFDGGVAINQAYINPLRVAIGAGTSSFDGVYSSLSGIPATFSPSSHSHAIADTSGLQTALDLKAPLANPALTGTPTAPTATTGTNTTQLATTAFVRAEVSALVAAAPGALDTLDELAAALGDDPNFATTITTALAGKQPLEATLTGIAATAPTADQLIYATGNDTFAVTPLTAFARSILDDANAPALLTTIGAAAASHTHGNITNAGAIGSAANLPLITTTGGAITLGSFGSTANTFCQGNDSRLSDARTPTAHTHPLSNLDQSGASSGQVASWNGSTWAPATVSGGGGGGTVDVSIQQFRLTTESGVSVSTSDRTAQSIIYLTPHVGNQIALWDGSAWQLRSTTEASLTLSGLTSGRNYDVFAYNPPAAANLTIRGTGTTYIDNSGSFSHVVTLPTAQSGDTQVVLCWTTDINPTASGWTRTSLGGRCWVFARSYTSGTTITIAVDETGLIAAAFTVIGNAVVDIGAGSNINSSGTTADATSLTATTSGGLLFCYFISDGTGGVTLPTGMTGVTLSSTGKTIGAAYLGVDAGSTGGKTFTLGAAANRHSVASVVLKQSGSGPQLELSSAWTNNTTRAEAIVRQDGVWCKSGALTRRLVGTIRTTGTATTEDSLLRRLVWNSDNRIQRALRRNETTSSWAYNSTTWRAVMASAANSLEWVAGLSDRVIHLVAEGPITNFVSNAGCYNIALTSGSTTPVADVVARGGAGDTPYTSARLIRYSAIGYNIATWIERTVTTTGACTFYGSENSNTTIYSGISGTFEC
jgi:hypothetical protein